VLAVPLGTGTALWLQADRQARLAQLHARQNELALEVNDALHRVAVLREKAGEEADGAALFAQAREQAQRALALVESGPADEALQAQVRHVKGELDEEEKDRAFIAALEAAHLAQAETVAGQNRFAERRTGP